MIARRRWIFWLITFLLLLSGAAFLLLVFVPGIRLKSLADALVADREFQAITLANIGIYKYVLAGLGLSLVGLAALTYFRCWAGVLVFMKHLWLDTRSSFRIVKLGKTDFLWFSAVSFLIMLAVVYRLEYLFSPLHHDEAYTYMAFAHTLRAAIFDYHLPNNHIFHSILVFISTQVLGNSPWVVRLPAFVTGVLLVPVVFHLGKQHYNRWVGLGAGLLVAISPALVGYSDNARGYTLVALFGMILLILGHSIRKNKNRFHWLLVILVSALGMYTIPAFLFPLGIFYVWVLGEYLCHQPAGYPSRINFFLYWFFSGVSAVLLTLVLYLPILLFNPPGTLFSNPFVAPVPWSDFLETLSHRLVETWSEWTFQVPLLIVLVAVIGFLLSIFIHKKISPTRFPLQLAAAIWIIVLLLIQRPNAWSKIWLFLLPIALLWVSAGILGLLGLLRIKSIPVSAIILGICVLPVLVRSVQLLPEFPDLWAMRGDEESAVVFVKDHLMPGDGLVVAPPDDASVWYYAEIHGISSALTQADDTVRWFVVANPSEGQTPLSVMRERGPENIGDLACVSLVSFGKLTVFECQEDQ